MGARFLVIDGYNLLHASGLAQSRYAPGQLARQRQRLLARLASLLTPSERGRTTIIFDARDPRVDRPPRHLCDSMQVVFARPHGDADLFIQHWLDSHPAPRHVTLVSGDRELQRAGRSVGARVVAGQPFLLELDRRRLSHSPPESPDDKPSHLTPAEAAAWLHEFGDVELPPDPPPPPVPPAPTAAPAPTPRHPASRPPRTSSSTAPPVSPNPSTAPRPQTPAQPPSSTSPSPTSPSSSGHPSSRPPHSNSPAPSAPPPAEASNTPATRRVQHRRGRRPARGSRSVPAVPPKPAGMTDLEFWLGEFGSLETPLTPLATPPSLVAELERWLRELSAD